MYRLSANYAYACVKLLGRSLRQPQQSTQHRQCAAPGRTAAMRPSIWRGTEHTALWPQSAALLGTTSRKRDFAPSGATNPGKLPIASHSQSRVADPIQGRQRAAAAHNQSEHNIATATATATAQHRRHSSLILADTPLACTAPFGTARYILGALLRKEQEPSSNG